MRYTIVVPTIVSLVAATLMFFALEFSGLRAQPASSAPQVLGEPEGEIKGDIDCNEAVEPDDALKLLRDIAATGYTYEQPCTVIGELIPAGEPIPGPQGPPGPQGEEGPPGISGLEYVTDTTENDSTSPKIAVAECPPEKTAIAGGGFYAAPLMAPIDIFNSGPDTVDPEAGNGWQLWAFEQAAFAGDWDLEVWAVCAVVAP